MQMTIKKYNEMDGARTTHFGFETVGVDEKAERIAEVFDAISAKYDMMNDVMSLGTHRLVKWYAIQASNIKPGSNVLDIAAGTAVRFEPGQERDVALVPFGGGRRVFGFRGDVMGEL